jgi:hypothetical protein
MFMRSKISFITLAVASLLMLGALVIIASSPAEAAVDGDFEYRSFGSGAEITAYLGTASAIDIPSEVGGLQVISIGDSAFADTSLTSVNIPDGVISIGTSAFENCPAIINIPGTVGTIEARAFYGCTGLTGADIPNGATTIGDYAFAYCTSLRSITIPDSVNSIGTGAFHSDPALTQINVGSGNTNFVSSNNILYNAALTALIQCPAGRSGDLTVPDSVTAIRGYSFAGCTGLTGITIPGSVTSIGASAFSGCTALTLMEFKGNSPSLGTNWLAGTSGLVVRYPYGSTGFTGSSWQGVTLVAMCDLVMSSEFGGTTSAGGTFAQGTSVIITATAPSANAGERYVWSKWEGSGDGSYSGTDQTHTITINGDITQHAVWIKQYQVTFAVSPVAGGTTDPAVGTDWFDAGALPIQANPSSGFDFSSWTSSGSITLSNAGSATAEATISGSGTITAGFIARNVAITITSDPAGAGYVLVDGKAIETPQTFYWVPGESHTLSAIATVAGTNEQYLFTAWSDAGALEHSYTVTMTPATITASFNHQYQLTIDAGVGTTTPSDGDHWYDAGSQVALGATAPDASSGSRYVWNRWIGSGTGSYSGVTNAATVTMNGPITETADWTRQYQITFLVTPAGAGTTSPAGSAQWFDAGDLAINAYPSSGYAFSTWSSDGGAITFGNDVKNASATASIGGAGTITATFGPLPVSVTITSSPAGSGYVLVDGTLVRTPSSFNWTPGEQHTIEAVDNVTVRTGERYSFSSWSDAGSRSHSYTVPMSSATITASFDHQFQLTMAAGSGTTTPANGTSWVKAGSSVTLNATAPPASTGSRYAWNGWTGTGTGSYTGADQLTTFIVNAPVTETAKWKLQYAVNVMTNSGTTTPANITWYDAGSTITLRATSPVASGNERYRFDGWVGSGVVAYNGMDNPAVNAVTVNGPINETASWTLQMGPGMVTNLTASPGDTFVSLVWGMPSDGGLTIDQYIVFQDGVSVKSVTTLYATITGLKNGQTYSFTVVAHNEIGNGLSPSAVLATPAKGANSLILEITSPLTGSFNRTGSVLLTWYISDAGSPVSKVEVSSEVSAWTTVTGTSYQMSGLAEGQHTLYVRATDAANNVVTRSVPIVVDLTAPTVSVRTPTPGGYVNNQFVTFNWVIYDNGSGLSRTEISTDGATWTEQLVAGATESYQDGSYRFYIRTTDNAGNVGTTIIPFTVDTVAPTVLTRSPSGNAESTKVGISITFSESMNRASTVISVTGATGAVVWSGNSVSFTPTAALRGYTSYTVSVNGTDLAGNAIANTWTFKTALWGTISGVVRGYDGKVLANAVVKLIGVSTNAHIEMGHLTLAASTDVGNVKETTTDAYGAFAFYDVSIGNYTLEVTKPGYLAKSTPVSMTLDDIRNGGLTVNPGASPASTIDGLLFLISIVAVSIGLVGLVLLVRKRRSPPAAGAAPQVKDEGPPVAEVQEAPDSDDGVLDGDQPR